MDVTVIGPGAVGAPLVQALAAAGFPIRSVATRSKLKHYDQLRNRLKLHEETIIVNTVELDSSRLGDLVFVTVPDDQIQSSAEELAENPVDWSGRVVAHCSGFHNSSLLDPIKERGADVAAFHPIQTFTGNDSEEIFKDIYISIEGSSSATRILKTAGAALGSRPFSIDREQKNKLHIAAVFLSNYLVALSSIADNLIRESIPGKNVDLLRPLLEKTAENLNRKCPEDVLTGPVSRGDIETVRQHLELLSDQPELMNLYKMLGLHALGMIEGNNGSDPRILKEIEKIFN